MILSDIKLLELLSKRELIIDPIDAEQIQPASVDIRLGNHFLKLDEHKTEIMTMTDEVKYISFESDEVIIPPHSFLLATTKEYIKLPNNLTAFVEGRSSIGRMGLFVQNAGWVDPGFEGEITLELYNANQLPIKVQSGRRICQLVFAQMDQITFNPYDGKYQGQKKPIGSRAYMDADI